MLILVALVALGHWPSGAGAGGSTISADVGADTGAGGSTIATGAGVDTGAGISTISRHVLPLQ